MDKIIIDGGKPLHGDVVISGSKNAALPCLFATLLTDEECVIDRVPDLADIDTTCALLTFLGKKVVRDRNRVTIKSGGRIHTQAPYELVRKMRASVLVLGPLIARLGKASASLPGGCAIGVRPVNIHLKGFEQLGAKTSLSEGFVKLITKGLKGNKVTLAFPSVGATENLLMAASLAQGRTVIENAAREPEIVDLADCLIGMGADIHGAGTSRIFVNGKKVLSGVSHNVIPDRIETATYLIAGAATRGNVTALSANASHIKNVLQKLKSAGLKITVKEGENGQSITCAYAGPLKNVSVRTEPYPGFPTDVQAQWMSLMSLVPGRTVINESVFENRFLHAAELARMGAEIEIHGGQAVLRGVKSLSGANVMVSDLRAGAAMVIAGLAAKGRTVVHRIYHLDRGYEDLEIKCRKLGASVKRVH